MNNKVVFITKHNPSSKSGGAYATRAYLEVFVKLYNHVTLFVADSFNNDLLNLEIHEIIKVKARNKVKGLLDLLFGRLTRFEKSLKSWKINNSSDIVVLDGGIIGGTFIRQFRKEKTITIHHNFERDYHSDNKTIESFKGICLYWIILLEKRAYLESTYNFFLTEKDKELFESHYGKRDNNYVIGCFEFNNIQHNIQHNIQNFTESGEIKGIITGSLNTTQSIKSIMWFIKEIYPSIILKYPNFKLSIAGRSPSTEFIEYFNKLNINVIDSPEDIKAVIASNDIYICPVKLGGGLKLRIMDALSVGIPSLIHEVSYRGYEIFEETGLVREFSDAQTFHEEFENILNLLKIQNVRNKVSEIYIDNFTFKSGLYKIGNILNKK